MTENLNIGTAILANQEQTNNTVIEKYCYDDNETNCNIYGGLYQWDECMNYGASSNSNPSGRQGICPEGWHVPSDAEWIVLTTYLGGESVAGGQMKETGTLHWASPNGNATNTSGFTGLPGGENREFMGFVDLNYYSHFWSATEINSTHAWHLGLAYSVGAVSHWYEVKTTAFSVRCLKD